MKQKKKNIISDLDNFSGDSGGDFGEWSVGRKDIIKNLYKTGKYIYTLGLNSQIRYLINNSSTRLHYYW